jgi:hypothetical protein
VDGINIMPAGSQQGLCTPRHVLIELDLHSTGIGVTSSRASSAA